MSEAPKISFDTDPLSETERVLAASDEAAQFIRRVFWELPVSIEISDIVETGDIPSNKKE